MRMNRPWTDREKEGITSARYTYASHLVDEVDS